MLGRVLNTLLISTPQCKYNTKFSKGRSERCERKQKRNEFDERKREHGNSFIFYLFRNITIMNETPTQVFFSEFCETPYSAK